MRKIHLGAAPSSGEALPFYFVSSTALFLLLTREGHPLHRTTVELNFFLLQAQSSSFLPIFPFLLGFSP